MPTEEILIVEDEQLVASFMKSGLERMGYGIAQVVSTGEEAIRVAKQCKPDLVLMDICLKGHMDGIEAASQLRLGSDIPVIFVTGGTDDITLERSKTAEPVGFLSKPFSAQELRRTIETGLNSYRSNHKRNLEALQAIETRYRNLFENAVQGIFRIGQSGRFVDGNTSFAKVLGYDSPKQVLDSAAEARQLFVRPERYLELMKTLKKSSFVEGFEFEAYRKDRTIVWLSQSTRAIHEPGSKEPYYEGSVQDISERKSAENTLKSVLARQAALLAAVPEIIMEVDVNKVYTWANKAGLEFFGTDVIGKEAKYYFAGDQETCNSVAPIFEGGEDVAYVESWQRRKDGSKRLLGWRYHLLKDPGGKVMGALSSARDLTEERLTEQERLKALARSVLLNQLQHDLLRAGELSHKLRMITEGIVDIFEADFCRIWLKGPGDLCEFGCVHASVKEGPDACRHRDKCLRLIASSGRYTHTNGAHQRIPFDTYKVGRIASGKEHRCRTNNVASDPNIGDHDWAKRLGLVSFAGFQLNSSDGECFGVLALFSTHAITLEEQAQLEALNSSTSQVILAAGVEAALRQSEERFRRIFQHSASGMALVSPDFHFLQVNEGFSRMLGYTELELVGKTFQDITHPEDRPVSGKLVRSVLSGEMETFQLEKRYLRKDGATVWGLVTSTLIRDTQNKPLYFISQIQDITERKQAQNAVRESEERFRLIADSIDEVFWMADVVEERMLYLSPSFERIWGQSRQELYENRKAFRKALHPEDLDRIVEMLKIQKTGRPYDHEYRIVRPDGSVRQIWDRGFPVNDGSKCVRLYVGVAQDVTNWRNEEKKHKEARDYLHKIINCIADPIFVKDRQHRFLLINDAVCATIGKPAEEIIGSTSVEQLSEDVVHTVFEEEDRVFETGNPNVSVDEIIGKDGHRFTFMSNKTLLTDADGNKQLVAVLRDISELKRAEKERSEMEMQLRQAQKLEAIGQLAAGIAHEINTPTQYISDNTRFMQDAFGAISTVLEAYERLLQAVRSGPVVDPSILADVDAAIANADLDYLVKEAPRAVTQSLEGLNRVATIVRAMREFSHPSGDVKRTIDLNHAIENTITVCRNEWKYVAEIAMDLDPRLPFVPCLPGDINQVILNLVVNAAHAIADAIDGNGKHKGTISINTRRDQDWVEIRISDTGTGIPEKYRTKIFTPFFTTKEVGKGTGQGLAISRSVIVGRHGGTIDYETEVGKGTTFIIRLPLTPVP
jgi:two-component system NtrC family sensor kinase